MKNILKSVIALTLFAGFWSCEDEQDLRFVSPDASFSIITPSSGDGVVLDQFNPGNPGVVLSWKAMDYGTPAGVNYTIQMDRTGNNFAAPIAVATTTNTFITIDAETLNNAALGAGLSPFEEGALDIRIMAAIGLAGEETAYSDVVNYLVTPYSSVLPRVYVVGNFQAASGYGNDWTPADGVPLASSSFDTKDYEGYVYLNNPAPEYKITPTNEGWAGDYGDDGSFSGTLIQEGESNILAGAAGYYRIKADLTALTYSAELVSWGIIGSATPTGWDSDTDMVYDVASKTFKITMDLTAGGNKIKFRANDAWTLNLGDTGADGTLNEGGDDIAVETAGNYTITLDLSNPRAYTYSLQAN